MKTQPRLLSGRRRTSGTSVSALIIMFLLLAIPAYALSRFAASIDWRLLVGVPIALSLFAFVAFRIDKRRAEAGEWRIPEATLHMSELLGGWPGSFLAQRTFRHKTSKASYQVEFWLIVIIHQLAAVDSLLGWKFTTAILHLVRS
jgi:uncharacterized membrane protein YsdA (DUF1294 family)